MIGADDAPRPGPTSLARSWAIQRRVIWALLLREILTRYGRHNIGFLWLFVEPMIFTLAVTALWTATKAVHGSNLPIVAFAITGYSSVLLWRNMPNRTIGALTPNLALLYHRNVRPIDIYLSRLLLEIAGASTSFVSLVLFFSFIGWLEPPEDVLQILFGWVMLAWFGLGLALFFGALSERHEIVEKLWHPASYILFPLSGAGFLVDALPTEAQHYVLLLPMVHGVEYVREGYFGTQMTAHYDMAYMAIINLVLTALGLAEVAKTSRTVIPE
ncbi:ABC transporter permease [Sphingomonas sp. KRR8]|uniref:ABC transporter permease n=1 Tax=Sphingomonas sp. KRR8 TaxID=2942996 RepID=UPI00201FC5AC|nr:ABC transporter permease [Sphingomonas sp. KRR8]URD60539.1 ABC transporter permease [Sphingomonas sp. KRR8]